VNHLLVTHIQKYLSVVAGDNVGDHGPEIARPDNSDGFIQ
jgi:hypothetical protein